MEGHKLSKYEQEQWFRTIAWQIHWAHAKKAMKMEKFWPIPTDKLKGEKPVNTNLFHQHFQRKAQDIIERRFSTYQKYLVGARA